MCAIWWRTKMSMSTLPTKMERRLCTMHYASFFGQLPVVQYLVGSCHANVEATTKNGVSALFHASDNGHLTVVQYLVEAGRANVEVTAEKGFFALYVASQKGRLLVVQYLVEIGRANVEATTDEGATPLYAASQNGHLPVVQYLVETGHDNIEAATEEGFFALYVASQGGHLSIVQYLVETAYANVEATTNDGYSALYVASLTGHLAVVQYLVETGRANIEAADKFGATALYVACQNGHLAVAQYLVEVGGANVEAAMNVGTTPLYIASKNGHLAVVQLLAESGGANVAATTKFNTTALDIAMTNGHDDVVAYLKQRHHPVALQTLPPLVTNQGQPEIGNGVTSDRTRMKYAVNGTGEPLAVSQAYIKSVLTNKVLGEGFFGVVYKGVDRELGCNFAIKAISKDVLAGGNIDSIQRAKQTFEQEQQTLSRFRHPNIAELFAYSFPADYRGSSYLIYEFAENGALDTFLSGELGRLRLSFRRRVQIALDVMTALQFLHVGNAGKGISSCFHCDVKSANIVLKQDLTAQLIDCGLAKFVVDEKGEAARALSSVKPRGTPGYMCPEYTSGQVERYDCSCDVYSFGVVLVELWTGKLQNCKDSDGSPFNFVAQENEA